MSLEKDKIVFAAIGIFAIIVILNSLKKDKLMPIVSENTSSNTLAFDHNSLPKNLKPPKRLRELEPTPTPLKPRKSMNFVSFMPRFEF